MRALSQNPKQSGGHLFVNVFGSNPPVIALLALCERKATGLSASTTLGDPQVWLEGAVRFSTKACRLTVEEV